MIARVIERESERARERAIEQASERARERTSERAIERASERAIERSSERARETDGLTVRLARPIVRDRPSIQSRVRPTDSLSSLTEMQSKYCVECYDI